MPNYESTFICSPEVPTEKQDDLVEKIRKIVDAAGGKIALTQQLGRKRLSYPINKFREGSYVYMELSGPGAMIAAMENFYKVTDAIIRYLTVKVEKKKVVAKPAAAPAPAATEPAAPAAGEGKTHESNQPASA